MLLYTLNDRIRPHELHRDVTFLHPSLARYGEWLELQADEGDGLLYNTTPTPSSLRGWTAPLLVDRHEGVHVGGSPEYVGVSLHAVHSDFRDGEFSFKSGPDSCRNYYNSFRNIVIKSRNNLDSFRNNLKVLRVMTTITISMTTTDDDGERPFRQGVWMT